MNHKRKGPKSTRAGCLLCKPHKRQGCKVPTAGEMRKLQDNVRDLQCEAEEILEWRRNNPGREWCVKCLAPATWIYMPSDGSFCDNCVPRGCTCHDDPSEPCVEFMEL
jgi:hypothetical protein